MSALHDLISRELGRIGIRAQDNVEDIDRWLEISEELSKGWRALHGGKFEEAAGHAKTASQQTEKMIKEELDSYIWERPAHME